MKLQDQQKEMTMKPWDRDINELERQFVRTQEQENMKLNAQMPQDQSTMVLIQQLKENYRKEIMTQYFNYGFNEESFKT
jgi:hypothetical protein